MILVFHVDSGDVGGVDVSGMTVAAVGDTLKVMTDGDWRLGILIDEAASDEQAEALGRRVQRRAGWADGEPRAPDRREPRCRARPDGVLLRGRQHSLNLGDMGQVEVEDVVPFGIETGEPVRLVGVFHPAGSELTIAKGGDTKLSAFGIEPALAGQSGFSAPFAWSA